LSDAVFAFSATLLVVSLEVPRTVPELLDNLRGFAAFGLSFGALVLIWAAHHSFFRRYGVSDSGTIALNAVLLFVVLFYVYPLKYLTLTFVTGVLGFRSGPGSENLIRTVDELAALFAIYSVGFVAVFACFALLHLHVVRRGRELDLHPLERFDAISWTGMYLIMAGVGALSVALALAKIGIRFGLPGMTYFLIGPIAWWHGSRRRRQREALSAAEALIPA